MAVHISGTVLASLFYDHSVSLCDQVTAIGKWDGSEVLLNLSDTSFGLG